MKMVLVPIAFTSKGNEILRQCNCELREHPFSLVAEGQMKASPLKKRGFEKIQKSLKDKNIIIEDIYEMYMKIYKIELWKKRLRNPLKSVFNLIRKFG